MGRVRQVSLDPRRTKRVFECLYYHGKDLCVGCREMVCSTLSHLRGHRNMPWERRSADTIYRPSNTFIACPSRNFLAFYHKSLIVLTKYAKKQATTTSLSYVFVIYVLCAISQSR